MFIITDYDSFLWFTLWEQASEWNEEQNDDALKKKKNFIQWINIFN